MALRTAKKRGTLPEDAVVELDARYHQDGCPATEDRLDWYTTVPVTGTHQGIEVAVIRCVTCGGERTLPVADLPRDDSE